MSVNPCPGERYARQIALPEIGAEGQRRICGASVLVVGLGGLGCPVCLYLAGAGVGRLGLADSDVVSLSNLQRQTLYTEAQAGWLKTEAASVRLRALRADLDICLYPSGLTEENAAVAVTDFDIVVDCTDNWTARFLIDSACAGSGRPWIFASIGQWAGMVSLMNGVARRRLADIFPDRRELESRGPADDGVIGALPGIIGSVQACAAIQFIATGTSPLDGALYNFDARTFDSQLINF